MDIKCGDRVTWRKRWYGQDEEEAMIGTVIEIGSSVFGPHAWISVENDQSPQFANMSKLTRVDKPDDFSDSLALHDDPFGVLGSLAEMDDVEASIRWAGATL